MAIERDDKTLMKAEKQINLCWKNMYPKFHVSKWKCDWEKSKSLYNYFHIYLWYLNFCHAITTKDKWYIWNHSINSIIGFYKKWNYQFELFQWKILQISIPKYFRTIQWLVLVLELTGYDITITTISDIEFFSCSDGDLELTENTCSFLLPQ